MTPPPKVRKFKFKKHSMPSKGHSNGFTESAFVKLDFWRWCLLLLLNVCWLKAIPEIAQGETLGGHN